MSSLHNSLQGLTLFTYDSNSEVTGSRFTPERQIPVFMLKLENHVQPCSRTVWAEFSNSAIYNLQVVYLTQTQFEADWVAARGQAC